SDPRAWARLLSAARLGRLLADGSGGASQAETASRKLKELGVLTGPAALLVLTWEDYGAALSLVGLDGGKTATLGAATAGAAVVACADVWWPPCLLFPPAPDADWITCPAR